MSRLAGLVLTWSIALPVVHHRLGPELAAVLDALPLGEARGGDGRGPALAEAVPQHGVAVTLTQTVQPLARALTRERKLIEFIFQSIVCFVKLESFRLTFRQKKLEKVLIGFPSIKCGDSSIYL